MKKKLSALILALLTLFCSACTESPEVDKTNTKVKVEEQVKESEQAKSEIKEEEKSKEEIKEAVIDLSEIKIPVYSDKPYTVINNNVPYFKDSDLTTKSYEYYSDFDKLGRCQTAISCVGFDLMPNKERESIGQVKPTGWHTVKYDNVDGKYLYNRCHLIGYQLTGENANEKNLITGTRYMNTQGMLPFENMVADYVKETKNHVLYRVTPKFSMDNMLCDGVFIEAKSVEDKGQGILFNVFCYNVQPGITIDYKTGESVASGKVISSQSDKEGFSVKVNNNDSSPAPAEEKKISSYVANKNTGKFHYPSCSSVKQIKEANRLDINCTREEAITAGFAPCKKCNP